MTESPTDVVSRGGREPVSGRLVAVVAACLLVIGVAGWGVDRRVELREERAVAQCLAAADREVARAYAPVYATLTYVRPVLSGPSSDRLRRGMYALVSRASRGTDLPLAAVRDDCRRVEVFWTHGALRERRDACVRRLDVHTSFLRAVAADGAAIAGGLPPMAAEC